MNNVHTLNLTYKVFKSRSRVKDCCRMGSPRKLTQRLACRKFLREPSWVLCCIYEGEGEK